jgi:hypothetical protein
MIKWWPVRADAARIVVSVATLRPDPLAAQAHYALDWVDRFDRETPFERRRPRLPSTWLDLHSAIDALASACRGEARIAVTGSLRLAPAADDANATFANIYNVLPTL